MHPIGIITDAHANRPALTVRDDGTWEASLRSVPYDGRGLLADYEARDVPARETILRIFHGTSRHDTQSGWTPGDPATAPSSPWVGAILSLS